MTTPATVPATVPLSAPFTDARRDYLDVPCLCCGARLSDPTSAAFKLGPQCRRRLSIHVRKLKANTRAADLIVRAATAAHQHDLPAVLNLIAQLRALDPSFDTLADRVYARFFALRMIRDGESFIVCTPYRLDLVADLRAIGGLYFSKVPPAKGWRVPAEKLDAVIACVAPHFPFEHMLDHDGTVIALQDRLRVAA